MRKNKSSHTSAGVIKISEKQEKGRSQAGPSALDNTQPKPEPNGEDNGEEKKKKLAAWRKKTKRKMKKAPRTTVREELPDVLVSLVEVAKGGSCPHAKILMEFADAENIPDAKEKQKTKTLAEMLIERLDGGKSEVGSRKSEVGGKS